MNKDVTKKIFVCLGVIITLLVLNIIFTISGLNSGSNGNTNNGGNGAGGNASMIAPGTPIFKHSAAGEVVDTDVALFQQILASNQVAIIYVGNEQCPACNMFFPTIETLAPQLNVDFFYVNTIRWDQNDVAEVWQNLEIEGTPTLVVMYQGQPIDSLVGAVQSEQVVSFLRRNNIID